MSIYDLYYNALDSVFRITHPAADSSWPELFTSRGMNQIILLKNLRKTNTAGVQSAKPSGVIELVDNIVLNHDIS